MIVAVAVCCVSNCGGWVLCATALPACDLDRPMAWGSTPTFDSSALNDLRVYGDLQDGATPAVLASKAGHKDVADLIVGGGNTTAAGRPAPATQDSTFYSHEQLQVSYLKSCPL